MNELIPIWMDPKVIDMTRLTIRFGNLSKRFDSYEEMIKWKKKANKLSPYWREK